VISDDWTIKPASTPSLLSLERKFGADGMGHDFEEVEVCIGFAEVIIEDPKMIFSAYIYLYCKVQSSIILCTTVIWMGFAL
jgi:hypothetical protein